MLGGLSIVELVCGFLALFFVSVLLTGGVRTYAVRAHVLDLPNERSSHNQPTPRAGGLSIFLTVLLGWALYHLLGLPLRPDLTYLLLFGATVAGVGLIDDHRDVSVQWRLFVHFAAAAAVVWSLGPFSIVSAMAAVLAIVWFINLFNFMDGIDGIAAAEAITVTSGAAVLSFVAGDSAVSLLLLTIAVSSAGFLVWNWSPAQIFMGDVGSGFLGFVIGSLAIYTHFTHVLHITAWLILAGVFVVDATWTLLRRFLRGVPVYQAHHSHAYQRASRAVGQHGRVTIGVAVINILWLFPLAVVAYFSPQWRWIFLGIAWAPLVAFVWMLGAGTDDGEIASQN